MGAIEVPGIAAVLTGIDVSHHNGKLSWPAIASAGVGFAYAKATEGANFSDPQFRTNWQGIKDAGMRRGAYHFFRPGASPEDQVNHFLQAIPDFEAGDLAPVLDLEEVHPQDEWPGIPPEERIPLVLRWLRGVENQLGVKPIVYVRAGWVTKQLPNAEPLADYHLWIAHYTKKPQPALPSPWKRWTMWQHTDKGILKSVKGRFDLNRWVQLNA